MGLGVNSHFIYDQGAMSEQPVPPAPSKIVAVHSSYRSRAMERGSLPAWPSYFLKPPSTLAADGDPVLRPPGCELLAFEGEVALIIGTSAIRVTPAAAWEHVGWVTAANDFGIHDLRYADKGSNVRSKGVDGFTPLGPRRLDARTVDPASITIRTWVNGHLVQDSGAADLTDGAIRDSETLRQRLDIPVYYGAVHPAVLGRRHLPWETNVTVSCGGVTIQPGDILAGDGDGVVVVPRDIAWEVALDAREQERQEQFIAGMVARGESISDLYPLGPRWRPAYDAWVREREGVRT